MKVLIGAPVRQDKIIFKHYINALRNLEGNFDLFFYVDRTTNISNSLEEHEYEFVTNNEKVIPHKWTSIRLNHVASLKNMLLQKALNEGYDYFLLVDSDLIVHPQTLIHLVNQKKDIVAEIYWTKFKPHLEEMPNAWLFDFYGFTEPMEESSAQSIYNTSNMFRKKDLFKVGGIGGCKLISTNAIRAGVNYSPITNVTWSNWEDRAFSIRASVLGFDLFLDTHYPATHLYTYECVAEYEKTLGFK